jgi:hypothetical protein
MARHTPSASDECLHDSSDKTAPKLQDLVQLLPAIFPLIVTPKEAGMPFGDVIRVDRALAHEEVSLGRGVHLGCIQILQVHVVHIGIRAKQIHVQLSQINVTTTNTL